MSENRRKDVVVEVNSFKKILALILCFAMIITCFAGCGSGNQAEVDITEGNIGQLVSEAYISQGDVIEISENELVPLDAAAAAVSTTIMPVASGKVTKGNARVTIDASNTADGYVMIKYLEKTSKRLKVIIKNPKGVNYTYNLNKIGEWETFPLSGGNGNYTVTVYQNTSGSMYSTVYSTTLSVKLVDEFAPYLLPNQYVDYSTASKTVAKAKELTKGKATDLQKIQAVYSWVVTNVKYDKQEAATVKSGYLPVVDEVLATKKGICFDYAALMTAMLRSQGIPCQLVVGYSGKAYHAWINTYTVEEGWVNSVIYFDGTQWKLMDPTYASSGKQGAAIMKYINNTANYQAKYLY